MEFFEPGKELGSYGLRAIVMVAKSAEGGMNQPQRALLNAVQNLVLHTDLDIDALKPITPGELSQKFDKPHLARQLVRGMVVMSLVDGPASKDQSHLISIFSTALRVDEPAVEMIHHLAEHEMLLFRLDFYRRSNLRDYLEVQYRTQGGLLGVAKGLLGFQGLIEDHELAQRFRNLENLSQDALGYHFFRHYVDNGFPFPGEKGGFPLGGVFHDFGHVLGGYDTSPEGEMKTASFQAGYRRNEDSFFTMLFAILIHTAGINMGPIEMPVLLGRIGQGDLAEQMIIALKRGAAMKVDLGNDWDYWPYVELPINEAREKLGVPK